MKFFSVQNKIDKHLKRIIKIYIVMLLIFIKFNKI